MISYIIFNMFANHIVIDYLIRSIDLSIDWLVGWLIDWLVDWLVDWLIDASNFLYRSIMFWLTRLRRVVIVSLICCFSGRANSSALLYHFVTLVRKLLSLRPNLKEKTGKGTYTHTYFHLRISLQNLHHTCIKDN